MKRIPSLSSQYIVYLHDQEAGPFGFDELKSMDGIGEISDPAPVRSADRSEWRTWREIRAEQMEIEARRAQAAVEQARIVAQFETAEPSSKDHSTLKIVVGFWIGCCAVGAVTSLIGLVCGLVLAGLIGLASSAATGTACFFIFKALDKRAA